LSPKPTCERVEDEEEEKEEEEEAATWANHGSVICRRKKGKYELRSSNNLTHLLGHAQIECLVRKRMQENILRTTLVEVFERETMVNEIQGRTGATPFPKTLLFECILLGFWHS